VDLERPIDLSREARHQDASGTPAALIEQARRSGGLALVDSVDEGDVLVDYPLGEVWRAQTGCSRFVELRSRGGGKRYALVRDERRA
jgi:hypothetical protein